VVERRSRGNRALVDCRQNDVNGLCRVNDLALYLWRSARNFGGTALDFGNAPREEHAKADNPWSCGPHIILQCELRIPPHLTLVQADGQRAVIYLAGPWRSKTQESL